MGWERRKGRLYYFRKERGADGRVRSVYVGAGEAGLRAEAEDKARRDAKREERRAKRRPPPPTTCAAPPEGGPLLQQDAAASAGAQRNPQSDNKPIGRVRTLSFRAASEVVSASGRSGESLAALIAGLDVDEVTRLLLRRRFLKGSR